MGFADARRPRHTLARQSTPLRMGSLRSPALHPRACPSVLESRPLRHVEPGQPAEATFKVLPGKTHAAKVRFVTSDLAPGQVTPTGQLVVPREVLAHPFPARLDAEDPELMDSLPIGAVGTATIFTGGMEATYIIKRVELRMKASLNYLIPR